MAILLYIMLTLLCIHLIAEAMRNPARIYQFPFAAAVVFLGFIAPPLLGSLGDRNLPAWAVERYTFMCILCLSMCWLGDSLGCRRREPMAKSEAWDYRRWLIGAALLVFAGGLAYVKNRALFEAESEVNTGAMVMVNFFVVLLRYGFVMSWLCFLKTRNRWALLLTCLAALFYLDRIILFAKRREMVELAFVLAGSLWFVSRRRIPRPLVIGGIVAATLFLCSTGAYRAIIVSRTGEREWSRLADLDPVATFRDVTGEGTSETTSGVYYMAAAAAERTYDFGLSHWNALVFNYVPAQILGSAFKESLYLPIPSVAAVAQREYGFTKRSSSTVTGMVDCYVSGWYCGCLKLLVIAYVMQLLYRHAMWGGVISQAVYLFMMTNALHAITHSTHRFVSPWVPILVFWLPVMLYAVQANGIQTTSWRGPKGHGLSRQMNCGGISPQATTVRCADSGRFPHPPTGLSPA